MYQKPNVLGTVQVFVSVAKGMASKYNNQSSDTHHPHRGRENVISWEDGDEIPRASWSVKITTLLSSGFDLETWLNEYIGGG